MGTIEACRVCLATDVKMFSVDVNLEKMYSSLVGNNIVSASVMPGYICYECLQLLNKFTKFRDKCVLTQSVLYDISRLKIAVTEYEIRSVNRGKMSLLSPLSVVKLPANSYDPATDATNVEVKEEPIGTLEMYVEEYRGMEESDSDDDNTPLAAKNKETRELRNTRNTKRKKPENDDSLTVDEVAMLKDFVTTKLSANHDYNVSSDLTQEANHNNPLHTSTSNDTQRLKATIQILLNQKQFKDYHLRTLDNQKKIIHKLSEIMEAMQGASNCAKETAPVAPMQETSDGPCQKLKRRRPISNVQEMDEFERILSDDSQRVALKRQYSILFSGGNGMTCAYALIDLLFARDFMTQCSWTGGSRGDIKVCFKAYQNILAFFFEMVHSWDPTFSLQDNETFIKTLLKNAKQRAESKLQRASTSRRRNRMLQKFVNIVTEDHADLSSRIDEMVEGSVWIDGENNISSKDPESDPMDESAC